MRKRFTESRTYEQAQAIAERRIADAIEIYDVYKRKEENQHRKYFIERPCPFCGEREYRTEEKFHDRYGVARCRRCNSLYVNPCPVPELLSDYYNNYSCNEMLEEVYQKRAEKENNAILDTRLDTIFEYIMKLERSKIRILEVGCSNGSFLSKLRKYIEKKQIQKEIEYIGVDTNENAIDSNTDDKIKLVASTIEDFLGKTELKFDIIWHTELVEHIIDPFALFQNLYSAMNHDSYMIFTTPNDFSLEMKSLSYNVPRVLACNIFPPMHLNAFSTVNVSHFALRNNFCVEEITTPGFFDVEIFEMQKEFLKSDMLKCIADKSEEEKEFLQKLISEAGASSHLQCVLSKN